MVAKRSNATSNSVPVWMTVILAATAAFASGACSGGSDHKPASTEEINAYLYDVNMIHSRAYGRFEQLVRIFDDSSYAEAVDLNSRRFKEGAEALRSVHAPRPFEDEHAVFVAAFAAVADELATSRQRIEDGENVSKVIADQIEGPLAVAFTQLDDACKQLIRQAEELGTYDALPCGGDPYFVDASEPSWSHRVFVNRCCGGGSDPASVPLDIFYGSDQPWARTAEHYRQEMEKRGFELHTQGQTLVFSKPDRPEECFSLEEYREDHLPFAVEPSDLAGLARYPYAYVAEYIMVCGG